VGEWVGKVNNFFENQTVPIRSFFEVILDYKPKNRSQN